MKSLNNKTMKKPSFHETVDVLVKAYLNDTLEVGNYCACAVGNLIAANIGATLVKRPGQYYGSRFVWHDVPFDGSEWFERRKFNVSPTGSDLIARTGYTLAEIIRIENAFENAARRSRPIEDDSEREFKGLMAVVNVLADIHNVDLQTKETAQKLFVK